MVTFPPCKINLGLHILSRRADGYHDIATCFYPVPWTDIVEILPADTLLFKQTGESIPGLPETNLCLKAYQLLRKDFDLTPVQIHLHKIIPSGAGLGGASSDGSHVIRILNLIFQLNLSQQQLMEYASALGSDCAFFIQDSPMLGTGRGEKLEPATVGLKGFYLVIIAPQIHVSSGEAYQNVTPGIPKVGLRDLIGLPIKEWRNKLTNDFEVMVFQKHPVLGEIKSQLYSQGALYASMSGSGSAVYGIFEKETEIKFAESKFRNWSGWL